MTTNCCAIRCVNQFLFLPGFPSPRETTPRLASTPPPSVHSQGPAVITHPLVHPVYLQTPVLLLYCTILHSTGILTLQFPPTIFSKPRLNTLVFFTSNRQKSHTQPHPNRKQFRICPRSTLPRYSVIETCLPWLPLERIPSN